METIVFEILPLPKQRNIVQEDGYLELHESYFKYYAKYECEEKYEDDGMPWKNSKVDLCICIFKSFVVSIEKAFNTKVDKWQIYLSINGKQEDVWIYYNDEKECSEIFEILHKYFFNGD